MCGCIVDTSSFLALIGTSYVLRVVIMAVLLRLAFYRLYNDEDIPEKGQGRGTEEGEEKKKE